MEVLLARGDEALRRACEHGANHPRLQRQAELALHLLRDHAGGKCPQIPYNCVALLAVALLYLLDPMDVIPDWLPRVGMSDDALVLDLAFELGAPGIERYCLSRGLPTDGLLPQPKPPRPGRSRR